MLIWSMNKIRLEMIDATISAELPDPDLDPLLHRIVTKHMVHGPCGPLNWNCPCLDENKRCTKKYPRGFVRETITGRDGYPVYRRRSEEDSGQVLRPPNRPEIDNRWIVPYSPALLRMFDAHINVEYCSSVQSIKYICKYINKGSDMAVVVEI